MTDGMVEISHFTYGWTNPVVAFSLAFLGALLGLGCTARSRLATTRRRQVRWLLLAAVAIGGVGIWLMHFMAMLGFDVASGPVRYDPVLTVASMLIAVATTGCGLFLAAGRPAGAADQRHLPPQRLSGRPAVRLVTGGMVTGAGVVAMHYTGMAALRVAGAVRYDPVLVAASVVIALVAATGALWCTLWVRRGGHTVLAAVVMAGAIGGMHYTGMAAVSVEQSAPAGEVTGLSALLLIVPITLVTAGTLLATALSALQAMTEEELDAPPTAEPETRPAPHPLAGAGVAAGPLPGPEAAPRRPEAAPHPLEPVQRRPDA